MSTKSAFPASDSRQATPGSAAAPGAEHVGWVAFALFTVDVLIIYGLIAYGGRRAGA